MGSTIYVTCFSVAGGPLTDAMHNTLHWGSRMILLLQDADPPLTKLPVEGSGFRGWITLEGGWGRMAGVASPIFAVRLHTPYGTVVVRYVVDCSAAVADREMDQVIGEADELLATPDLRPADESVADDADDECALAQAASLVEQAFGLGGASDSGDPYGLADALPPDGALAAPDELRLFLQAKHEQSRLN